MTGVNLGRLFEVWSRVDGEPDPDRREQLVAELCAGDAAMEEELRGMLAAHVPDDYLEAQAPALREPPSPPPQQQPPQPQLGDFELVREIGRGGSAVVWLARQPALGREVAIKIVTAGPGTLPAAIERFEREAVAVGGLSHPHIVPVLDHGRDGATHWLAMQLVDGHGLDREIESQRRRADGRLLPDRESGGWFAAVARLVADVADALAAAHARAVVHRDIKPQNLLLDRSGRVFVCDFGLARDDRIPALTESGVIAGSWHYMSPEQARVISAPVTRLTDVYSLGVVLYELLTLVRPFEGETAMQLLREIESARPRSPRQLDRAIPRDLETICLAAMQRQPEHRYRSVAELRDDLERFLGHRAIVRQPPSGVVRAVQSAMRHAALIAVAAIVVAVMMGGLFVHHALATSETESKLIADCARLDAWRPDGVTTEANAFDEAPVQLLGRIQQAVNDPDAPEAWVVDEARERLAAYRLALMRRIADGLPTAAEAGSAPSRDPADAYDALQLFSRAVAIFPDDPELGSMIPSDPNHGVVDVSLVDEQGQPVTGTVEASQVLLWPSAAAKPLGTTPILGLRLPQGLYLFRARVGSVVREFCREVSGASWQPLQLTIGPEREWEGMKRIEGGRFRFPESDPPGVAGQEVEVRPFYIDAHEVTIAQYGRYRRETGRLGTEQWQALWALLDRRDRQEWPMVFVSPTDAQGYAEWAGKRLPTLVEWNVAALGAGPTQRTAPWVDAGPHGVYGPFQLGPTRSDSADNFFLLAVAATDAAGQRGDCTPEGVLAMFGNVEEWTLSPAPRLTRTGLVAVPGMNVQCGASWASASAEAAAFGIVPWQEVEAHRGFRCIRRDE